MSEQRTEAIRTLRRAAQVLRRDDPRFTDRPPANSLEVAVADWLEAEAAHAQKLVMKTAAVNLLLQLTDGPDEISASVTFGYSTLDEALKVARTVLGELVEQPPRPDEAGR